MLLPMRWEKEREPTVEGKTEYEQEEQRMAVEEEEEAELHRHWVREVRWPWRLNAESGKQAETTTEGETRYVDASRVSSHYAGETGCFSLQSAEDK
jgi:hypothetical protein